MTKNIMPQSFFKRPVLQVAQDMLGKTLICTTNKTELRAIITEVEAYDGQQDLACHAARERRGVPRSGKTKRTEVMFGPAGRWYIYLCYGMHWMLNIVTGEEGYPAAVLIRGISIPQEKPLRVILSSPAESTSIHPTPVSKKLKLDTQHDTAGRIEGQTNRISGPGRLTKTLSIDGSFNDLPSDPASNLWLEEGIQVPPNAIEKTPRIGVDYAGEWAKKKWRFVLQGDML